MQDEAQQKPQPLDKPPEVVALGGQHGVDGVAFTMGEEVAAHAMVLLGVADHGFDGGAALELAFDGFRDAPFLALGVDLELMLCARVVALIAGVRQDAGERAAPVMASMPGSTVSSVCPS